MQCNRYPWAECKTPFDFSEIAEAFIPHSYSEHDNYWRQASRTVFCSMLQKFDNSKKISELVRWILFEPLASMCSLLQSTKAASHMDINSEKTASSVRSVVSTFLECLECLEDTKDAFSIRDWISNDTQNYQGSWLFLHCNPDQRASAPPLLRRNGSHPLSADSYLFYHEQQRRPPQDGHPTFWT